MDNAPIEVVNLEALQEWYKLKKTLEDVKTREMELRKQIFGAAFTNPKEGINSLTLPDGYSLKATHVISRTVDKALFSVLREEFLRSGIHVDNIVQWEPKLSVSGYRTLTEEEMHLFDQCLIIKPGSPSMDITAPKAKK